MKIKVINKPIVELVDINSLKFDGDNPNITRPEQDVDLQINIEEWGFLQPIIIDQNNLVCDGEHRINALKKLGDDKIPAYRLNLTDVQRRILRQVMNKLRGQHDDNLDIIELKRIIDAGGKEDLLNLLHSEEENFNRLFKSINKPIVEPDDIPEIPKEAIIKRGDIIKLGRNRLMCGDSTVKEDVDKLMDGKRVDMVFTDPPYGMNLDTDWSTAKSNSDFVKNHRVKGFSGNKYESVIGDNEYFNPEFIFNYFNYCKEIFLFGADYYCWSLPKNGSWFVWDKRTNNDTREIVAESRDKMYGSSFELCWSKNKHKREIIRQMWAGIFGTENEPDKDKSRKHPTQKPVNLFKWFINKFSKDNDLILDIFGGSGTILIACEDTGRINYSMEIDPLYCQVCVERWINFTGRVDEVYVIRDGNKINWKELKPI